MAQLTNCKKKREVIKLVTEEQVAVALAQYTAALSEKYIKEKGSFNVVLSGGTLIHTMRVLAEVYKDAVDWSKWRVFWVDERVVPLDDNDSNYKLANEGFFKKVKKIPKQNIYPIHYSCSAHEVACDYESRLKTLVQNKVIPTSACGFPKFDLMLLGIGPDGHIASLFPNRPQRYERKHWVTSILDSPKPPPQRITMTFPVINCASNIAMVVTGKELADPVAKTLGGFVGPPPPIPCSELEMEAEGEVTWILDKGAASKLHHHHVVY
ncbi:hypothetical protein DH2020_009766 [Rehmannia glutinosa]|uniref:Probable 6-phosphogluconolactonase n=1 Tax=Rehmannia glutinosa TaxID=99300 RepID=A0ABR0X775_REHGL